MRLLLMVPYVGQLLRVSWLLFWDGRIFPLLKVLPIAAVVYVISPVDLLRDHILGIGQIDDALVTLVLLTLFVAVCPRKIVREHIYGGRGDGPSGPDPIEGKFRYLDCE
jgi:uncharacterized membrane protein YkvA (DUF1232 family)